MLLKKFKQDEVEKFCVMIESKAWGKDDGSGGGDEGMVGKAWDAAGTDDEAAEVDSEGAASDGEPVAWGIGSLFHFDWSEISPYHEGGEDARDDCCTILVERPLHTVNAITMNGAKITAHKIRLPVRCFEWPKFWELRSSVGGMGIGAEMLNPSVPDGRGEGGGVNITLIASVE